MLAQRRSVLDPCHDHARDLQRGLGRTDNAKLDEYFQSIRDIETRLSQGGALVRRAAAEAAPIGEPRAGLAGHDEIRLMYDLIVAGAPDRQHARGHLPPAHPSLLTSLGITWSRPRHEPLPRPRGEQLEASQRRDLAQSELLAGLLDRLKAMKEPDGSRLFDHTAVAFGSNIRTGH